MSKVFLYSKWIDTSSAGTLRLETVFVYNYLGYFWHTMKVLPSHLPMWTVPSCWYIWLVTCLYQCNDMKSYVLSACQVFYIINECKSHSLLHSEIRGFCCSLSAESLRCKYVSKMHFNKRIFVVSTNAVCSVHFSVNVMCVFAMIWLLTTFYLKPSRLCFTEHMSVCLSVCLQVNNYT